MCKRAGTFKSSAGQIHSSAVESARLPGDIYLKKCTPLCMRKPLNRSGLGLG